MEKSKDTQEIIIQMPHLIMIIEGITIKEDLQEDRSSFYLAITLLF